MKAEDLTSPSTRILLYGIRAQRIQEELRQYPNLELVTERPDVVVSYGGDGTLLHAELDYPSVPKVPILNSKRGHRCIPHPPAQVIAGLAAGRLVSTTYTKLACTILRQDGRPHEITALNEINVHMGRINSAVRFKLWLNGQPYENGEEILGDGFLVCTPFGSTAYFSAITRAVFFEGIGIAFKATTEKTNHIVMPESYSLHLEITRGPAVLAYDAALDYLTLDAGDELEVKRHSQGATILTCGPVQRLDEPF